MKNFSHFGKQASYMIANGYGVIRNLHSSPVAKKFAATKLPQKFRPFLEDYFATQLASDSAFCFPPSKIHVEKFGDEMVKFLENLYHKENCQDSYKLFQAADLFVKKEVKAVVISNLGDPLDLLSIGMWVNFDPNLKVANPTSETLQSVQDNIHAELILMAYANRLLGCEIFRYNSKYNLHSSNRSFSFIEGKTPQRPHKDGIELCGVERQKEPDALILLANQAAGDVATYTISDEEIYTAAKEKLSARTLEILQKPYFYYCQEEDHHMYGVHIWPSKKYPMISFQDNKVKINDFNGDFLDYFHFEDPRGRVSEYEGREALKEFINLVEELSRKPETTKIFLTSEIGEDRQGAILHHNVHGRTVDHVPQPRSLVVTGLSQDPSISISNPIISSLNASERSK